MSVKERIRMFGGMKKKYMITVVLLGVLIWMGYGSYRIGESKSKFFYPDELEVVAATINGSDLTLRDMAVYVAYEEAEVEQQAKIYNPQNPAKYWNVYTNHTYIRKAARNAAIRMAVHDELFYQMSKEEGVTLTLEEEEVLANDVQDFWADLVEEGKEQRLGINQEDVANSLKKIALAQKMQTIYAEYQGLEYEDFDFVGEEYSKLLEKQEYQIYSDVWKRVDFGNITIKHEQ